MLVQISIKFVASCKCVCMIITNNDNNSVESDGEKIKNYLLDQSSFHLWNSAQEIHGNNFNIIIKFYSQKYIHTKLYGVSMCSTVIARHNSGYLRPGSACYSLKLMKSVYRFE